MSDDPQDPWADSAEFWEAYLQADLAELASALRRHGPRFAAEAAAELARYLKAQQDPPASDDEVPF